MKKLGDGGIRKALLGNVLLLILAGICAVGVISYLEYNNIYRNLQDEMQALVNRVADNFDRAVVRTDNLSRALFFDEEFQNAVKKLSTEELDEGFAKVENYVYSFAPIEESVRGIAYLPPQTADFGTDNCIFWGQAVSEDLYGEIVSRMADAHNSEIVFMDFSDVAEQHNLVNKFAVCRKILDVSASSYYEELGYGCFFLQKDAFGSIASVAEELNGFGFSLRYKGEQFYTYGTAGALKVTGKMQTDGWEIEGFGSTKNLRSSILYSLATIFAWSVPVTIVFVLLIVFMNRFSMRSFDYLIDNFRTIRMNKQYAKIEPVKDKSVNRVIESYNLLVDAVENANRDLVEERSRALLIRLEMKEYELNGLNSQINKHFLFNMLTVLRSIVKLGNRETAVECINRLSSFMRYSLDSDKSVTLAQEMELLSCYLYMQGLRFGETALHIDLPEELSEEKIPRMILQPLVENAFSHGMVGKDNTITIRVRKREEGELRFLILDDGAGMTYERVREVNDSLQNNCSNRSESGNGIALVNVLRRIRFLYSEKSSIRIDSREGKGTAVLIRLKGEQAENV